MQRCPFASHRHGSVACTYFFDVLSVNDGSRSCLNNRIERKQMRLLLIGELSIPQSLNLLYSGSLLILALSENRNRMCTIWSFGSGGVEQHAGFDRQRNLGGVRIRKMIRRSRESLAIRHIKAIIRRWYMHKSPRCRSLEPWASC